MEDLQLHVPRRLKTNCGRDVNKLGFVVRKDELSNPVLLLEATMRLQRAAYLEV
jgi:hypothetical protein